MKSTVTNQMQELAERIEAKIPDAKSSMTTFPSGGGMLDVHRGERLFVMSYTPADGFGVDEVKQDDGFVIGYQYLFPEFEQASEKLWQLAAVDSLVDNSCSEIGLNLIVIYSRNVEKAKHFYSQLGIIFDLEKHGSGPEHYSAKLGSMVFEIYPCHDRTKSGATRIGFNVSSVDKVVYSLRQFDTTVLTPACDSPWGRRAVVADPDGNRVELTQKIDEKQSQTTANAAL